ncbi:MAG: CdaR family protein, partial [Lachnospiraceae bacterium]
MFKKLMKHVTNDIGLKILSILFSVVLWLVVINIANPDKTKSFSIPVEIQNKNIIEEMGKVPDVVGDTDIASFYIIGPRNYVEDMEASDFTVTADLSQIDLTQDYDIKLVPIQISVKKNEKYITVYNKTVNMKITLEELSEQTFVVSPEITGTPDNGYAIGEAEVTPNLLKISGPKSVVSKINKVLATINVDGIASDVSDNVIPVLYDEEGNVISSDLLEMNQSVVTIKANVLGTKS